MKYPMSMIIIVTQLDEDGRANAAVSYEDQGNPSTRVKVELELQPLTDATDPQMWAQMAAARVCDAL